MSKAKKSTHSSEDASSSSGSSSSGSSDEEIDARDLKPIKDYLSDRHELARQLFKSVKAEKIRMMLPQALKKMDIDELEEWCSSELSGMSKSRILCILNGKTMAESSDTNESDDSGPSLEIISDTEEWFTDDDTIKKEEGSQPGKIKVKKDRAKLKEKSFPLRKNDNKNIHKKGFDKDVQVKQEGEKVMNKEGDSLLDLLELEMRARAIRALIRNEEDVIPASSVSKSAHPKNNNSKTVQDELKAKENCRIQLERIISAQRGDGAEDEDVVLVVQPTPTIELLSSDSEGEGHSGARINKKLQNERIRETEQKSDNIENGNLKNSHDAKMITDSVKESKNVQEMLDARKDLDNTRKQEVSKRTHKNDLNSKNVELPSSAKFSAKKRKVKKKLHAKQQAKTLCKEVPELKERDNTQSVKTAKSIETLSPDSVTENVTIVKSEKNESNNTMELNIKQDCSPLAESKRKNDLEAVTKVALEEDKSIDLDEIIDLDDYCEDMEDMENSGNDKTEKKKTCENEKNKYRAEQVTQKSNGAETWASRYYQTDDVQNVIKESKIQSEIRKRLRERQRLSKLNKSPSQNSSPSSPSVAESTVNKPEQDTIGLVDEYLALKHAASSTSSSNNKNGISVMEDRDVSNGTCADVNKVIMNDRTISEGYQVQTVDKRTAASDDVNCDTLLVANKMQTVTRNNDTNAD